VQTAGLKLENLELQFGSKPVLRGINLEVSAGEMVAVLGSSGTGKSTLLRILAGLIQPNAGSFITEWNKLSFVFQEPRLMPWLKAWENVVLGLNGSRAELKAKAGAALSEVGLSEAAELLPKELSGGMAQRVALARGLVVQPQLLLLDEPFSAVDALTRLQLHQHLLTLWQTHRFAAMLVTHDVDEAITLADRIIVLAGSPASIIFETKVGPRPRNRHDSYLATLREELLEALATGRHAPQNRADLGLSGLAI
jgi:sulfonate transport system ATP-binding protein